MLDAKRKNGGSIAFMNCIIPQGKPPSRILRACASLAPKICFEVMCLLTILVAAKEENKDFWNELACLLGKHFSMLRAFGGAMSVPAGNPSVVVSDMKSFASIKSDQLIVVYKDVVPLSVKLTGERLVAVVDSSDSTVTEQVSATKLPAITCGLFARDTITLSSMNVDSAVIGIQRSISCFDGSRAEPQDIPVKLAKSVDSFTLMCAAAVLILSGNIKKLIKGKM